MGDEQLDPSDLFNTGFNVADVNTNHGDEGARVQGFLEAAEHMAARMAKNRGLIDIEIYPALYLYRHGLELGFKAILVSMDYENNQTKNRYHHRRQEALVSFSAATRL